ncbi:hypothetical protein BIW11_02454 [Tropilaelaps mercedesae]|uniref:Uncharacterized protein n=1 Tax=Tropilaelaps mercedesae TaxID=418985 RepID=A0A1V9Y2Z2_9ACAR|nr:hypothetical protein BIW11_02454 [Tropilaelaps mercedesae]
MGEVLAIKNATKSLRQNQPAPLGEVGTTPLTEDIQRWALWKKTQN